MNRVARLSWPFVKEVRALVFPWLAAAAAVAIPPSVGHSRSPGGLSVPALFAAAAVLGAMSIGHEYTDRTLGSLLSLPARRARLLAVKFSVLAVMLLTLAALADALVGRDFAGEERLAAVLLPVLYGLFVAPWLTMACRNPVAGAVFTVAAPAGLLLIAGRLAWSAQGGYGPDLRAFLVTILWRGSLALGAVGAVVNWWMFGRLEAIEDRGADVRLPRWLRPRTAVTASRPATRHPVWLLVAKELRLQQMTLVVASLFALGWLAVEFRGGLAPDDRAAVSALAIFYSFLLPLLGGAFASAEERRLGTLEWQVLLPMSAARQWAVKIAVLFAVTLLLAFGLPLALATLNPVVDLKWYYRDAQPAALVVLLTAGGLYVSSLCRSGLWAMLMSMPATVAASWFTSAILVGAYATTRHASLELIAWLWPWRVGLGYTLVSRLEAVLLLVVVIGGVVAVLLRFALANHRSAALTAGGVARQVVLMAAFAAAGFVLLGGLAVLR